jgi:hypothetical protein
VPGQGTEPRLCHPSTQGQHVWSTGAVPCQPRRPARRVKGVGRLGTGRLWQQGRAGRTTETHLHLRAPVALPPPPLLQWPCAQPRWCARRSQWGRLRRGTASHPARAPGPRWRRRGWCWQHWSPVNGRRQCRSCTPDPLCQPWPWSSPVAHTHGHESITCEQGGGEVGPGSGLSV